MPINFSDDQVALLSSANALQKMWGADTLVGLLDHIGALDIEISNTAPLDTTKLWFDPHNPSTDAEGVLKKYDGAIWQNCTEVLLSQHIATKGGAARLDDVGLFTRAQRAEAETITYAANIALDFGTEPRKKLILSGNVTLDAPLDIQVGAQYVLEVTQDATGGRTVSWNSVFKFAGGSAPTISTDPNAKDIFYVDVLSSTELLVSSHIGVA